MWHKTAWLKSITYCIRKLKHLSNIFTSSSNTASHCSLYSQYLTLCWWLPPDVLLDYGKDENWEDLCCRKSLRGSCRVSALQIFISRPQEADRGNSNCSCLKATSPEGLFLPPSCFICQSNLKVILSLPTTNTWPECGARSNLLIRSWEAFSTFLSVAQKCVQRSVISSLGKPLMYGSTRRRE